MPEPAKDKEKPDPSPLADTAIDIPGLKPDESEAGQPSPDASAEVEYIPPARWKAMQAARAANPDVALEEVLDRPDAAIDAKSLLRFDPEAGKTNVAIKIRAATEAIRNTLNTPFGKLLLAIVFGLGGIGCTIAAVTFQTTPWIVAAALTAPIGLLLVYLKYQAWLGHKRYMYRLLETLGEDVTDFDPRHIYRNVGSKKVKR